MLKLPNFINVGGQRIPIQAVPELRDKEGALAMYCSETRTISIDAALNDRRLIRDCLTHEVIHCALDLAGISFNTSGVLSEKIEEQVVTAVESLAAPAIVRVHRI